jgi:hypothetical protein
MNVDLVEVNSLSCGLIRITGGWLDDRRNWKGKLEDVVVPKSVLAILKTLEILFKVEEHVNKCGNPHDTKIIQICRIFLS